MEMRGHSRGVKKKRVLLLGAVGVVLAGVVYPRFRRSAEPYYDGRPLSFWVASLGRFDVEETPKGREAVDHIGVAAVPYLLGWMQFDSTGWRERLASRLYECPWRLVRKAGDWVWPERSLELRRGSYAAFTVLGQRGYSAFGQLRRVLDNTNFPQESCAAALALGAIGTTNCVPVLVRAAVTPGHLASLVAVHAMRPYGRVAVDAITNFLGGTNDFRVQITAIESLGLIGDEATNAAPALSNALTDADPGVRAAARDALRQIAPRSGSDVPVRLGSGHEK